MPTESMISTYSNSDDDADGDIVLIIFERTYGDRALDLLAIGPVWMVASDVNEAAALKASSDGASVSMITLFDFPSTHGIGARVSSLLPAITKHHPECAVALSAMLVSPQVRRRLERAGYSQFTVRDFGGEPMIVAARRPEAG